LSNSRPTSTEPTEFRNLEAGRGSGETINFSFGRNWQKYLHRLDDERLGQARASLRASLHRDGLDGLTFIDAGCGSGVFSLSALQLRAAQVTSVDIDPNSISCARYLRARLADPGHWDVRRGSLLSTEFVATLPPADIVYSWGVLHHTGAMWSAIANAMRLVKPSGLLCLALYREPGKPKLQLALKRSYNLLPRLLRPVLGALYYVALVTRGSIAARVAPWSYIASYGRHSRGMSLWRDVEDWLGGLPCEFATPHAVEEFAAARGFVMEATLIRPRGANNEYLLRRIDAADRRLHWQAGSAGS
jgi:2-polyprenyl-6-hydroxyphenyl methylase/3-demethylubiquinone-9 3-methyltransferase